MRTVYVQPEDGWEFFKKFEERMKSEQLRIAEAYDRDISIYMTTSHDYPVITVYKGEVKLFTEYIVDEDDCNTALCEIYRRFLPEETAVVNTREVDVDLDEDEDDDGLSDEDLIAMEHEDAIAEREDELLDATIEYLCVILGASDMDDLIDTFGDDLIETFLDKACTYLYDEQGWSVYRPLYVDGVYTEKPYELEEK